MRWRWRWLCLMVLMLVIWLSKPAFASLNITGTATPTTAPLGVGTVITYTISGINTSSFGSTITLTDRLPFYTTYNAGSTQLRINGALVSTANPASVAGPPQQLTWNNGGAGWSLTSGSTYQLTFTATLNAPVQGNFASTMTVTDIGTAANTNDPATGFETALVTVGSPPALLIGKTVSPTAVATGGTATYTMTLQNSGGSSTSGLIIIDTLPTGFVYNAGSSVWNGVSIGNPTISGQTLTWQVPTTAGLTELPAASSRTLQFSVTAPGVNGTFDNLATTRATNVLTGTTGDTATLQVGTGAQMFVCKSIGPAGSTPACNTVTPTATHNANPDENYRYMITVYNTGTGPITINRIEDYRAAGTLFTVGSAQRSINGGGFAAIQDPDVVNNTMTWQGGPFFPYVLPAGQNLRIRWTHVSPGLKSGVFNNAVCVYNSNTSTNCTGPTAPLIVDGPVYGISKSVVTPTPATLTTGGDVTYEITVTNTGTATGSARITDTWTNGWTWVNNSTSTSVNGGAWDTTPYFGEGTGTAPNRTWNNVNVSAGGNVRIRFTVRISNAWAAANPGVYPNNAQVRDNTYTDNDIVVTGDAAPVTVNGAPQIAVDKTVTPAAVLSFQTVQYTIRFRNASTAPVSGIVNGISDTLPTGFTYQPGTSQISSDGATFAAFQNPAGTTGTITWSGGPGFAVTLAPGAERWLRFTVQASGTPGTYTNNASALGQNFVDVPTGPIAPVQVADGPTLTTGKGAATGANVTSAPGATASVPAGGGVVSYTVTVTNTGPVAANNVSVTDTLPPGFTYTSLSSALSINGAAFGPTGDPSATTGTITWAGPYSVPAGGSLRLRFTVTTTATAGSYNNTATISGSNFTTQSSGPTATVTVGSPPNVTLAQTPTSTLSSASGGPSSTTTYTYQMTNAAGAGTAQGVTFSAILPQFMSVVPGTVQVSVNGGAFTSFSNPGNLTGTAAWSGFANIPAGQNIRIRFTVAIDALATNGYYVIEGQTQGSNYALATLGTPSSFTGNPATSPMPVYQVTGAAAVHLVGFTGEARSTGVLLKWHTGSEWQNLGYNLYRQEGEGDLTRINGEMIGGLGNSASGGHFQYTDASVQPGHTYTYWLEDVEFGGPQTRHGPMTLAVPADGSVNQAAWSATPVHLPAPGGQNDDTPPQPAASADPTALGQYLTVLRADDQGMDLELRTPQVTVQRLAGKTVVVLPGLPVTHDVGLPHLPEAVVPVSAPRDVPYRLQVLAQADPVVLEDLQLAVAEPVQGSSGSTGGSPQRPGPVPAVAPSPPVVVNHSGSQGPADDCNCPSKTPVVPAAPAAVSRAVSGGSHLQFAFGTQAAASADAYPAEPAMVTASADLRHERLLQLKLYPVTYEPGRQRLTQYRKLRVRLTFDGATTLDPATGDGPWERAMTLLGRKYGLLHRWTSVPAAVTDGFERLAGDLWTLKVQTAGMQRLTAAQLQAAGVDVSQPDRLRLRHRDQDVPIDRQMAGGQLEAITFHVAAAGSAYTGTGVYLLSLAETPVAAMPARPVTPEQGTRTGTAVEGRLHLEENALYWGNKPVDAQSDHWFWDYVSPDHDARAFSFELPAPTTDAGESGTLTVGLRGLVNDPQVKTNNHVRVSLNGTRIGDLRWQGQTYLRTTLAFANTLLRPGTNTLTVTTVNDTGAQTPIVYVDAFDLTYWRQPVAADGTLAARFSRQDPTTWTVSGFASEPQAYDLTDADRPVRLTDAGFVSGSLSLTDPDPAFAHEYWVGEVGRMATPSIARFSWQDDLHGAGQGADYLVLTPAALRTEADRLALHRGAQGLSTRVVALEAIYDEFAGGHPEPEAIRRFLRWAVANWAAPKPAYVVLFGDGHYDFRNHFGSADPAPVMVPPLLRNHPEIGAVPDENAFAAVIGDDDLPDLMVGRLPAGNLTEAATIVDKLIAYDTAPAGDWQRQGLLVADAGDPAFSSFTAAVGQQFGALNWQRLSVLEGPQVRQALSDGVGLSLYVGHGYMEGWSDHQALSIWRGPNGDNDFDAMAANDQAGIMVTANCLNGYFHDPDYPSLGEVALRTAHKGTVGFWGTAGYTISSAQFAMTRHFLDHLLNDRVDLGTASTLAKIELFGDGNPFWKEELAAWVLLGDPATVMRR